MDRCEACYPPVGGRRLTQRRPGSTLPLCALHEAGWNGLREKYPDRIPTVHVVRGLGKNEQEVT